MAKPLTSTEILAALMAQGDKVKEMSGWKNHNRNHVGQWGGVNGVMVHHTGSNISHDSMESYLYRGDSSRGLPGPLCQFAPRRDGTVTMVGWGRANHAGKGDADVLSAVIAENYGSRPPAPDSDSTDGNARFYGIEMQYSGGSAPEKAQYDATVKICAAICKAHGWSAKSVIAHREWTRRKVDPGKIDMAEFRKDVQAAIDGKTPAPKPPTQIPTPKESDVPTAKEIAEAVWAADVIPHNVAGAPVNSNNPVSADNPTWKASSVLEETENRLRVVEGKLDILLDALNRLRG